MNILIFIKSHLISILALALSTWNLYSTQLKKFKLTVYNAGRYDVSVNFFNSHQLALYPIFIFSNRGAKSGIIENIALKFYGKEKSFILAAHSEILARELNLVRAPDYPLHTQSFCSFSIAPKETTTKKIMFVPYNAEPFEIPAGTYTIEVFIKTSINKKLKRMHKYEININQNDLQTIRENIPPGFSGYLSKVNFQDKKIPALDAQYEMLIK